MSQSFSSSSFVVVLPRRFFRDQQTEDDEDHDDEDEEDWNTTLKPWAKLSCPFGAWSLDICEGHFGMIHAPKVATGLSPE
jgi:hypothetical protein